MSDPIEHPTAKSLRQSLEMVADDRTACFEELGRAQARLTALEAENKALREGLRDASSALFQARSYRGYEYAEDVRADEDWDEDANDMTADDVFILRRDIRRARALLAKEKTS